MKFFRVGVLLLLASLAFFQCKAADYSTSAAVLDSSRNWFLLLPVFAVVGAARKFQRPVRKQPIAIPRPRQPWQGR